MLEGTCPFCIAYLDQPGAQDFAAISNLVTGRLRWNRCQELLLHFLSYKSRTQREMSSLVLWDPGAEALSSQSQLVELTCKQLEEGQQTSWVKKPTKSTTLQNVTIRKYSSGIKESLLHRQPEKMKMDAPVDVHLKHL